MSTAHAADSDHAMRTHCFDSVVRPLSIHKPIVSSAPVPKYSKTLMPSVTVHPHPTPKTKESDSSWSSSLTI